MRCGRSLIWQLPNLAAFFRSVGVQLQVGHKLPNETIASLVSVLGQQMEHVRLAIESEMKDAVAQAIVCGSNSDSPTHLSPPTHPHTPRP